MTREEAIKDIEENILPIVGGVSLRMAIEALKECVPKKGKWSNKFKSDPSSIFGTTLISVCSNCNKENSIGWTKYCPHCGVEMENGGEE